MQDSSNFQYLAIDTIHESTTNPRQTFEQNKLEELAESIRQHGLIQPITVRPNSNGFEIVAGARRFRSAQLAELFHSPPVSWNWTTPPQWSGSWSKTPNVWTFTRMKRRRAFSVS